MSLRFKINLSKTNQEEEDGYKGEENPSVWEMDLLRGALFRYRDHVKCISTNNSLAPSLCKLLCFKGCRGCEGEGETALSLRNPTIGLQEIVKIKILTEFLLFGTATKILNKNHKT